LIFRRAVNPRIVLPPISPAPSSTLCDDSKPIPLIRSVSTAASSPATRSLRRKSGITQPENRNGLDLANEMVFGLFM